MLVLAPTAGDAALTQTLLTEAGLGCHICPDLLGLCREIEAGVAVILLTEEVLADDQSNCLVEVLRRQPPWSDVPILLLSGSGADSPLAAWAMDRLGNVTILERPVRITTLISSLRAALRGRHWQYELRHHIDALQEADRRKDEFLATLAHELRNPLAPLRNGLQVMKLARHDANAVEQARAMMERQLRQMVHLIDDLLDLSRVSRDKVELRKERVPLTKVVYQAVETSRPLIDTNGHDLIVDIPPEAIYVDADPIRLAQVIANLLNNAAKYTDRGGRVTLTVERQGSAAVISVRDTGIGIPAHMLPKVFDIFTQVDRGLDRSQGGLGIGLSLVKKLVEMHGGTVEARSEGHGMGSEFVVRLPVALSLAGRPGVEDPGLKTTPAARRRILVVDDNKDSANSLAMLLRIMGNETQTAHDGLETLDVGAAFHPDVILLDIGMPKMDGYQTARRIRQEPWGKNVVLVAQTGWGQEGDIRRSHEAGFDTHMVKPVDPAALEQLLATLKTQTA